MADFTTENIALKEVSLEIWKRILNNLPYLYKTKGTKRGLEALISCYGIPTSILKIREYGGPDVDPSNVTEYTFDNFSYALDFSSSFVSFPWTASNGQWPQSIQFRFLTSTVPPNSMSLVEVNDGSQLKWGLETIPTTTDKGKIRLKILTGSSAYAEVSSSELPLFDGDFNSITLQRSSASDGNVDQTYQLYVKKYKYEQIFYYDYNTLSITDTSGNLGWVTGNSTFYIGGNDYLADPLIASFDELRFWNTNLTEKTIDKHVKHPTSIIGNTITSSYNDLVLRMPFDDPTNHYAYGSGTLQNEAPSELYPTSSMQIYGFANETSFPYNYTGYNYFSTVNFSNIGGSRWSNKIRIESSSLQGNLRHDLKVEKSEYDLAPRDSNKLGIYFSPTTPVNEDIIEFLGLENIGDLIGDPRDLYSGSYVNLDTLKRLYWDLSDRKITVKDYLEYIRRYDSSLFENIKKFLPARVKALLGLVYEPHILERSKVKYRKPAIEDLTKDAVITSSMLMPSTKDDYTGTVDTGDEFIVVSSKNDYVGQLDTNDDFVIDSSKDDYSDVINVKSSNSMSAEHDYLEKNVLVYENSKITSSDFEKFNIYSIIDVNANFVYSGSEYFYEEDIADLRRYINIGNPDYTIIDRRDLYRLPNTLDFFDNFTESTLTSSVIETILPYVNFEKDNNIYAGSGSFLYNNNIYQIYDYRGDFKGTLGAPPSGSYSKYHYKWLRCFSTSEKRLKHFGCKNTIDTTFDLKEPVEVWYSNPNEIQVDDKNDSYVSVV